MTKVVPLIGFLLVVLASAQAHGARLLNATVDVDGQTVLRIYYDDNGRAGPYEVWRYLATEPIMVDEDLPPIDPSESDPLRAVLEGDIVIRVNHSSNVLVEVEAATLDLVRSDEQQNGWHVLPSDVERLSNTAGLTPDPARLTSTFDVMMLIPVVVIAIVGIGLILAVGFAITTMKRRYRLKVGSGDPM